MEPLAIQLEGVSKAFGDLQVLDDLDLAVPRGSSFVLLGGSGSGKTVLLKIVAGLLRADRGEVKVLGHDLNAMTHEQLAEIWRRIGILFQAGALFDSVSVFENLSLPLHERTSLNKREIAERIHEALELLDLRGCEELTPGELSGGMRKRVAFARAIVLRPELLLFDEPTAGLDPLTTQNVAEEIELAKKELGSTVLAITHDLTTAFRVADRIGLLHQGRIVGASAPAEFERNPHPAIREFLHTWHEQGHRGSAPWAPTTPHG